MNKHTIGEFMDFASKEWEENLGEKLTDEDKEIDAEDTIEPEDVVQDVVKFLKWRGLIREHWR